MEQAQACYPAGAGRRGDSKHGDRNPAGFLYTSLPVALTVPAKWLIVDTVP